MKSTGSEGGRAWRYEVKGACEERAWPSLLASLRQSSLVLRRHHPDRVVQSVYFDTPWHDALRDNLAGISERSKLRFRWYGAEADHVQGVLERKLRRGVLGSKDLWPIAHPVAVRGVARHRFAGVVASGSQAVIGEVLTGREPVQWIRYEREYWCSFDGRVRITADTRLRAVDLRCSPRLDDRWASPLPRLLVLEAKVPEALWGRVQPVFQELGLRADRCSKFVWASEPTEGPRPFAWEP